MQDRTPPADRPTITVPRSQRLLNGTVKTTDQASKLLADLVTVLRTDPVDVYELHVQALALVQVARALAMVIEDLMVEVAP